MVETITPVVYGGRGRWAAAVIVHATGAALVASVFGALLGWGGRGLGAPFGAAGLIGIAVVASLYALAVMTRLRIPVPALRRQVPDWWRTFFSPMVTAFLYGAGLGIGFFTYLATGALFVVSVAAVVSGSPAAGAVMLGAFGLARGFSPVVALGVTDAESGRALVDRLAGGHDVAASPGAQRPDRRAGVRAGPAGHLAARAAQRRRGLSGAVRRPAAPGGQGSLHDRQRQHQERRRGVLRRPDLLSDV